ncbi:MAG: HlyD family efflux transporter periplasmic adaptor subunit [Gammaproteobacteria bacterium]|nr:HlyD family efflux transporter periplasmic adaptor subunit [Gammaproteobacteria bacterium]
MQTPRWRRPSVLIILAALVVAALLIITRDRSEPLERPERAWVVEVQPAVSQTLRPTLELFGSVQSPQNAQLSAGVDGLVNAVNVLDGETVVKDQLLILLDDRDVRLELQQADADLREVQAKSAFAERRLARGREAFEKERELLTLTETRQARAQGLAKEGLLSQSDLDTTAENLKRQQLAVNQAQLTIEEVEIQLTELSAQASRARALRDQARLDLERTSVRAPFDGVASELEVSEGDRVRENDVLLRLQNPAAIEVRTQIPARYAESVTQGIAAGEPMAALVQTGDVSIAGRLVRISGQTREASGGVDSFIRFEVPPRALRLGSTVRVFLDLPPEENVIALPAEALYGRNQVYKLVDGRMQMVEVERVGERARPVGGTEVLVRSATLEDDDQIVVTKLSNAADGLLTQPTVIKPGNGGARVSDADAAQADAARADEE